MAAEVGRLDMNAETFEQVYQYYQTRALQMAWNGAVWDRILVEVPGGWKTSFTYEGKTYDSFYVVASERNKGKSSVIIRDHITNPIVTVEGCNVRDFLESRGVEVLMLTGIYDSMEYKLVMQHYADKDTLGGRRARRSRMYLMNHIDEGVYIMQRRGVRLDAQRAFCLHPLLQDDADLKENFGICSSWVDARVMGYALEYRNIANAYLSHRSIKNVDEIALSPLPEVNEMLVADKIQNYKDFILYHADTHRRASELDEYFSFWLERLNVVEDYWKMKRELEAINPPH